MCFVCLVGAHDFSRSKSVLYVLLNPLKDIAFCKSSHNGKTSGKKHLEPKKRVAQGKTVIPTKVFSSAWQYIQIYLSKG